MTEGLRIFLDRPVRAFWRNLSFLGATIVFVGFSAILGGPSEGDAVEVVYGTWAVAHGRLDCVYPSSPHHAIVGLANPFALAAPLYGFVSGVLAAVVRIGHSVPFPTSSELGTNCSNGFDAMFHWSVTSSAIEPTVRLGYIVWAVLLVGVVAAVRATGRGKSGWEIAAATAAALTFPIEMSLTYFFHPQDILALGLILVGVALFLRGRWAWCGVALGLALCSQQFAVLAAVPLLILAPRRGPGRFLVGLCASVLVVDGSVIIAAHGRGIRTVLLGSSRAGQSVHSHGGTILSTTGVHGLPLFLIARVAPIVAAAIIAYWIRRRTPNSHQRPDLVVAVVAAGLLMRLVFEENLFGYYFAGIAILLVVLDVVRRRLRGELLAWFGLLAIAFTPEHVALTSNLTSYGLNLFYAIPIAVLAVGLGFFIVEALRRRVHYYMIAWLLIVTFVGQSKLWGRHFPLISWPTWVWQVILVCSAVALMWPELNTQATAPALPASNIGRITSTEEAGAT